jgi:hypothetical protein
MVTVVRVNDPSLARLREKFRVYMNDKADHIAMGGCLDFADYRHQAGLLEGFAEAETLLIELDQKMTVVDEEDEDED